MPLGVAVTVTVDGAAAATGSAGSPPGAVAPTTAMVASTAPAPVSANSFRLDSPRGSVRVTMDGMTAPSLDTMVCRQANHPGEAIRWCRAAGRRIRRYPL
ncbi:hypothetical protein MFAL_08690 [Mycolicibacterium fallax]|nr:hypothetical protein MFAL_08690 [Mycolicibacterium fallax]